MVTYELMCRCAVGSPSLSSLEAAQFAVEGLLTVVYIFY